MWSRISLRAILIAFIAEIAADFIIQNLIMMFFAQGLLPSGDPTEQEMRGVIKTVSAQSNYLLTTLVFGTATTIGGGYFAARLAKEFPYYNGLGIGIVGILFAAVVSTSGPAWFDALGFLMSIPASIYGAHLAKKHMAIAR